MTVRNVALAFVVFAIAYSAWQGITDRFLDGVFWLFMFAVIGIGASVVYKTFFARH